MFHRTSECPKISIQCAIPPDSEGYLYRRVPLCFRKHKTSSYVTNHFKDGRIVEFTRIKSGGLKAKKSAKHSRKRRMKTGNTGNNVNMCLDRTREKEIEATRLWEMVYFLSMFSVQTCWTGHITCCRSVWVKRSFGDLPQKASKSRNHSSALNWLQLFSNEYSPYNITEMFIGDELEPIQSGTIKTKLSNQRSYIIMIVDLIV